MSVFALSALWKGIMRFPPLPSYSAYNVHRSHTNQPSMRTEGQRCLLIPGQFDPEQPWISYKGRGQNSHVTLLPLVTSSFFCFCFYRTGSHVCFTLRDHVTNTGPAVLSCFKQKRRVHKGLQELQRHKKNAVFRGKHLSISALHGDNDTTQRPFPWARVAEARLPLRVAY